MDIERKAAVCVSKTIFTLANEPFVWKLLLFPEIKFIFFVGKYVSLSVTLMLL